MGSIRSKKRERDAGINGFRYPHGQGRSHRHVEADPVSQSNIAVLKRLLSFVGAALFSLIAFAAPHPFEALDVNVFASTLSASTIPDRAMPDDSMRVDLSVHEWEHRLLLVFAPSLDSNGWVEQREMWSGRRDGFEDRDLRIYMVGGKEAGRFYTSPGSDPRPIRAASARALRNRFDVALDDYAVVLVGKDGTEKRRDEAPVDADAIFETIDAMPMRRAEMRNDG